MNDTTNRLAGLRIAVTGANRGIGRAMVEAFAREGAALCVHARTEASVEALRGPLEAAEALALVAGDLRDDGLGERIAAEAREALGGLDVLVLNAGVLGERETLAEADRARFRETMAINVDAQLPIFQAAVPLLKASGGTVIWMTSGLGHMAVPRYGAYCVSKHGVEAMAKLAAVEHEDDGIVSVGVAPGMVQTEMLRAALDGGDISDFRTPAAVAEGFVALIQTRDAALNGQIVGIDAWL